MPATLVDYAIPLIAAVSISFSMVLAKLVLRDTDAGSFMFFRSFSGLVLSLLLLPTVGVQHAPTYAYGLLALSVLLAPFLMNMLFFTGVRYADVGTESAILQSTPVFVVLGEAAILNVIALPAAWVGVGVILAGVVILVSGTNHAPPRLAVLLGLAAAAVNGTNLVILAVVLRFFPRITLMAAQNIAYAAMATVMFLRTRKQQSHAGAKAASFPVVVMSIISGLLVQVIFIYLKLTSIERLGSLVTSVLVLSQLPVTMLLSCLLLGDRLHRRKLVAAAAIVLGAVAVTLANR